jgi:hypothetical protein
MLRWLITELKLPGVILFVLTVVWSTAQRARDQASDCYEPLEPPAQLSTQRERAALQSSPFNQKDPVVSIEAER